MDYEDDVIELLVTGLPGTIDELMTATDNEKQLVVVSENNINGDHLLDIDTNKGGLGFEADVETNNKVNQEECDEILERFKKQFVMNNDHVGLDAAISIPADGVRDNLKRDTISAPWKLRKKSSRWTKKEHSRFKKALKHGLKGNWKDISRFYIPSKTPAQITSHAQKYSNRKNNTHRKRKSINDDDTDDDDDDDDDAIDMSSSLIVHNDHQPAASILPPEIPDHVNNTLYHPQQVIINHDPSSSMPMVNQISPPMQIQYPSPILMAPPTTTSHHHHMMNMAPPLYPHDDVVSLYYANHCRLLEEERKMMMLKLRNDMIMPTPISGLLPGAAAGYSFSNGYNNNVGSSSNFAANTYTTTPTPIHHDASYYNGHFQRVQPLAAEPLVQYDEQIGHDHHVLLPPGQLGPDPTNRA